MSTMTAGTATHERHDITWRDAVTPMSRASRRRWALTYALLLVLLAADALDDTIFSNGRLPLILVVPAFVVFGMLRRGTRRITALDHPDLDERDVAARDRAYRIAFPLLVVVVLAALPLLALSVPDTRELLRADFVPGRDGDVWVKGHHLVALGLWIALWALFLPTGVLAWREPDAIEPETGGGSLHEPLRDALLGLALGGCIAVSIVTESDVWLPFVAALAMLGGLARRAAGQPMMSRQRMWRVAIGMAMIVAVIAIGVAVNS